MSDGLITPEPGAVQTPPTPISAGTTPKTTKTKPRAKPKAGSERPVTGLHAMLAYIAYSAENVNWEKATAVGGYKTLASARVSFYTSKKKYLESQKEMTGDDDGVEGEEGDAPVNAKKRKATKAGDGETSTKKGRKLKVEQDEDED